MNPPFKRTWNTRAWAVWTILFCLLPATWSCTKPDVTAEEWMQRGIHDFQAGKYREAILNYRKALDAEPENPVTHNLLGMAYRFRYNLTGDQDMQRKETAAFRRAIELSPDFLAAIKNLAASRYRDGDAVEAAELARRALRLFPQDPEKPILESWIRQGERADE